MKVIYTFEGTQDTGALWQNTLGEAFMQVHIANYERKDSGWTFTGIGAQPQHIRNENLTSACADFLKRRGLVVQEKQIMFESERQNLTRVRPTTGNPFQSPHQF